ncbi:hypothetical protein MFUL124B02_12530 [Myxococcus fulvus 124B02]|nr:hypothetical protein MFUL124B02_12530 [Myxococcus fulvus 124B02]
MSRRDWLFSLWLDSREELTVRPGSTQVRGTPRTLFYFSDNSWVGLVQSKDSSGNLWHELDLYNGATGQHFTVGLGTLVQPGRYFQFGMKVMTEQGQRKVAFYINGRWHSTLTVAPYDAGFNPMWSSMSGWTWMTVSDPGPAFMPAQRRLPFFGWVDELRIYALSSEDVRAGWTEELMCNQALGTLVDIAPRRGETWNPALESLRFGSTRYPGSRASSCGWARTWSRSTTRRSMASTSASTGCTRIPTPTRSWHRAACARV